MKHPRRLTLGVVDGIAESESIVRPGNLHGNVAQQLKSKVCLSDFGIFDIFLFLCFFKGSSVVKMSSARIALTMLPRPLSS